ncbi:succinyldiaminopimelate desuccinylase [Stella humosa]|uniref:Succinyl-diaminopimelate desuccinylase n=1 Tax=Stella humosa TaxID=94 RepID=A0A3N1L142_9PROT|nr:succinyl-diaminopimelate desuccinylase [Stella humosa]ROP84318.1 succinyldiaminopimelate desuccinylase [Stella humosa]BBK33832.1 succinyl-diaminopimelate desuccinylase [Stella humosa]
MNLTLDPVALTQALIRCPSVTPVEAGVLDTLQGQLEGLGFRCRRMPFSEPGTPDVDNLFARIGEGRPHFSFAGHTDVVPVGKRDSWRFDPFAGEERDGWVWGRGASDMKCGIAAFAAAAAGFLAERGTDFGGSISLLITGDEEGPSVNGTKKMLAALAEAGEVPDACIVGEPTNPKALGDMIKIGRRGSLNAYLTVHGVQGHVAYPHLADNPIHRLVRMLASLTAEPLDDGTAHFEPSTLQVATVDVGNPATNVIPAEARAVFNIRFNDAHTSQTLIRRIRERLDAVGGRFELDIKVSGESFVFEPGLLSGLVQDACEAVVGRRPELSTTGGTSDARFIQAYCPVVEFGGVGETMHQINERQRSDDIRGLARIYRQVLDNYFPRPA